MMLGRIQYILVKPAQDQHRMEIQMEHRESARFNCNVPVEGKTGSAFDETYTVDISKGGIGFLSSKPMSIDEKIAVEIDLSPDDEPAIMMGRVLWVTEIPNEHKYRVGMQFGDILLDGSQERLKKYLKS